MFGCSGIAASTLRQLCQNDFTVAELRFGLAAGNAIGKPYGYIAASAVVRGDTVAGRDTGRFAAAGLSVVNPWKDD